MYINVTVQVKISLVHTSSVVTSVLYSFYWERQAEFIFTGLLE